MSLCYTAQQLPPQGSVYSWWMLTGSSLLFMCCTWKYYLLCSNSTLSHTLRFCCAWKVIKSSRCIPVFSIAHQGNTFNGTIPFISVFPVVILVNIELENVSWWHQVASGFTEAWSTHLWLLITSYISYNILCTILPPSSWAPEIFSDVCALKYPLELLRRIKMYFMNILWMWTSVLVDYMYYEGI